MQKATLQLSVRLAMLIASVCTVFLLIGGSAGAEAPLAPPVEYVVEAGDTLWDIAAQHSAPGADVRRLVDEVIRKLGRIDVLINLVGGFAPGPVKDTAVALWQRMLTTNLTAAFLLSKAVLPHMEERETGRILHVAAWAAVEPFPGAAAYLVAKSGLLALIKVLALELKGSGVTVNAVLPTTIDTPANRASMPEVDPATWTRPESIAETLIFLASDEAVQINGATVPIGTGGSAKPAGKS